MRRHQTAPIYPVPRRTQAHPVSATLALMLVSLTLSASALAGAQDLTEVPLEQLLAMDVYSASHYLQKASDAPASVTVISALDIRDHGWRTLGDITRSVRGMYVSYDRNYSYVGERGLMRPGDYNTRFLLLIDGNRINDSIYDQAPIGAEFPLDLELIERVEFVPGPGSSVYGSNALFGVINVITKSPGALSGLRGALEAGSAGARKASVSGSWSDGAGGQYLLAASSYRSDGHDLYFPEYDTPEQHHGVAEHLDYERGTRLYASATRGALNVSLTHAERLKGVPTASFGQLFNDPRSRTTDRQSYLNAVLRSPDGKPERLTARLFLGSYDSFGDYVGEAGAGMRGIDRDGSSARWWGAEVSMVSTRLAGHTILAGAELQRDARLRQYSYDLDPFVSYLAINNSGRRAGLYLQDEVALSDTLLLNLGARYDSNRHTAGVLSPRLALIYALTPATTIKAIQGSAYRAPNSYELFYAYPGENGMGGQRANPELRRERIGSTELVLSHEMGADARLAVSAFRVGVHDLITQTSVASETATEATRFDNAATLQARGMELEYQRQWRGGARLRTSYSLVALAAAGQQVSAPTHLAKFNLAGPLPGDGLRGALESQYVGERRTLSGRAGAYWLVNANLLATRVWPGAELSLGIYNLLNRRYADPGSTEHLQATLPQDGRQLQLRLAYAL